MVHLITDVIEHQSKNGPSTKMSEFTHNMHVFRNKMEIRCKCIRQEKFHVGLYVD